MKYTNEKKQEIQEYEKKHGTMAAHRTFGVAKKTLYNWRNPDIDNATRCKIYYYKNVECRRANSRKYYHDNREESIKRSREYKENNVESTIRTEILRHSRRRAICKDREFNLDKEWLNKKLESGVCEKTNIEFVYVRHSPYVPSIDRIDSTKGYTKDNCQVVCKIYNLAKNIWDDKDVMVLAEALVKDQREKTLKNK